TGLSVPGDSMEFRKYFSLDRISNIHARDSRDWPQDAVVPLMALAQHHGIPTRLLDWSDDSIAACCHAAESVVRGSEDRRFSSGRSTTMAVRLIVMVCLGVLMMASSGKSAPAEPAGRITGVGGVFFKAKDPKALA